MKLILCIDDTDNLESKGTGTIASEIRKIAKKKLDAKTKYITRHQLLLHEDIEYTSHNSSMAFELEIDDDKYDELISLASEHLRTESAEGSDPGMAILNLSEFSDEEKKSRLIDYGFEAKRTVLTKEYAYKTAEELDVFLDEFGGNGEGIIGALAGAGLRMSKNDGEVKGSVKGFEEGEMYKIKDLLENKAVDDVASLSGEHPDPEDDVLVPWKAKQTIINGKRTVLVEMKNGIWETMVKDDLRKLDKIKANLEICEEYTPDVEEEHFHSKKTCLNCRYRRWEEVNFSCLKGKSKI